MIKLTKGHFIKLLQLPPRLWTMPVFDLEDEDPTWVQKKPIRPELPHRAVVENVNTRLGIIVVELFPKPRLNVGLIPKAALLGLC